ncbi:hypothetical protein [Agrococcus terreus]|nr:hypothetical protein [Agrococcus terreus]
MSPIALTDTVAGSGVGVGVAVGDAAGSLVAGAGWSVPGAQAVSSRTAAAATIAARLTSRR